MAEIGVEGGYVRNMLMVFCHAPDGYEGRGRVRGGARTERERGKEGRRGGCRDEGVEKGGKEGGGRRKEGGREGLTG